MDHLDWLPRNERTIDKIIFEKTSKLLNSKIVISKQPDEDVMNKIKKNIEQNRSKKEKRTTFRIYLAQPPKK